MSSKQVSSNSSMTALSFAGGESTAFDDDISWLLSIQNDPISYSKFNMENVLAYYSMVNIKIDLGYYAQDNYRGRTNFLGYLHFQPHIVCQQIEFELNLCAKTGGK